MDDPNVLRALHGQGEQRSVPVEPGEGADGPVDRLRPPHPDGLRPRPRPRPRRGRQGRRAGGAPGAHDRAPRRHPRRRDEHLDDDQRSGGMALRPLRGQRRAAGRAQQGAARHHAERHREGVPVARHVHLPAVAFAPADRRHDRVLRGVGPAVEPHERVQLPPAGGGCDARAGAGVLARHRHRRARRGEGVRSGRRRPVPAGLRVDQLLREQRHPVRGGDRQDARLHPALGPHRARALRGHRSEGAAVPLRRAGEQPRAHRGATREQRAAHRAGDAGRHAVAGLAGPLDPAPRVERGAGAPPTLGPAVGAADAAGARLRDRSPRVPRPVRGLEGDGDAHDRARPTGRGRSSRTCSRSVAPSRRSRS